jgi:predicted ribosome quality control (RQC) complex YloA/Tae2 family protein
VQSLLDKLLLKKQRLMEEVRESNASDHLRLKAELLTAALHSVQAGDAWVTVDNYYDGSKLAIELDPRLSAAKNAQNYYKRYGKIKKAGKEKLVQLAEADREIQYIESVLSAISLAENYETLEQIRSELSDTGYLRIRKAAQRKPRKSKPNVFRTLRGMEILAGKSNVENDRITFSLAGKGDLWFHAKDIPGSHVVLLCRGQEPEREDILEAASLAAFYSKAGRSDNVPVDYTQVRHVRKPSGAKPGMVLYASQKTIYVNPKELPKA